jgi:ABC-type nitrate/sulfonate/bicarbonate transport system permease component
MTEERVPRSFYRCISPVALLLIWELASRSGVANPLILPPPSAALADLVKLALDGELSRALWTSLYRILCGFALGVTSGIVLGAIMARMRLVDFLLDPLVELLRPISPLAIFPLAILWFGIGDASKIFIIALAASFPVILNTYAGVRSIDPNFFRASQSLGATSIEIFTSIVLPGSLPQIFTGVRLAWGISLIVIIAAEMVGASNGIGYMVLEAQQTFRTERVFAGIIVIGLLGFVTDLGFRWLRRVLLPWYRET